MLAAQPEWFVPSRDSMLVAALDASIDAHTLWAPLLDDDGQLIDVVCVYTNPTGADLVGRTTDEVIGCRLVESAQAAGNPSFGPAMLEVVRSGIALRQRIQLLRRGGGRYWADVVAVRLAGGLSLSGRDVTAEVSLNAELQRTVAELARLADTDPLTGLGNRRTWTRQLAAVMHAVAADGAPLVVALLDLDRFKDYNDTHGHLAGDELLRQMSASWREVLPPRATIARLGGEEFGLALPYMTPAEARQLLSTLCSLVPSDQTCSAGMTLWDRTEDERSLLGRTDAALYAAKHAGRNRVEALLPLL